MKILRRALESVTAHARESLPHECCGILLAQGQDLSTVACALPAENTEREHPQQRYSLGHRAHIKAVEMEASNNVRIAGYYHSHPDGGTKPSHRDMGQAVIGATYLIISIRNGSVEQAAWRLADDHFVPEPLEVIE